MVIRNIVRQLETPDRLRGRMTGINMVFFIGGPQLGELEAGAVANWFGAPFSVDHRRHRLPDRDRLGGGDDAGAAQLSALVISSTVSSTQRTQRNTFARVVPHSCRRASMGSTRDARLAGT